MNYEESKVKPRLPEYAMIQGIEWTEREIVFISLITNIAMEGGWNTTYQMNIQDCTRILKGLGERPTVWKNLRKIFDIGILNKYTVSITPHQTKMNHLGFPKIYRGEPVVLKDIKVLMVWYYLVGRLSCGDVLGEPDTPTSAQKIRWTQKDEGKRLARNLEYQVEWPLDKT
jgi:hypothetical protein|tara:strand:- start:842 stop:1354 length:513 start_codon:yes stop_codon:yes gene_type:complete